MSELSPATEPNSVARRVVSVLSSESLIEKAFLLLLTAVLTGAVIPQVVKSIDSVRDRNAAHERAKMKLFEDASEVVLTYESLILDVSWFGTETAKNEEMQVKAFERYTERVVDLTAKWRIQVSRAYAFASPEVAAKLQGLLKTAFDDQDTPMNMMWKDCKTRCKWDSQHERSIGALRQANAVLAELARDLRLNNDSASQKGA